jgi:3-dehydroquinate synthase
MKTLTIRGATGNSDLLVGERIDNAAAYLPAGETVVITDRVVAGLYRDRFPKGRVIEIDIGESIKTLETLQEIYAKLVAAEADRSTFVLGVGGGIVCDITGFAASTYMRGVRFGFVATTLLAQVDASVGGKNGVNFGGYKNMVGVFNQPEFVICDLDLLKTLPKREVLCGMAEIVKHGAIADPDLFAFLEGNAQGALDLNRAVVERLVYDSVVIKSEVVSRDEREAGERRKLNFGHTFGHAIEKTSGVPHGEAVSAGMAAAARLSVERGLLDRADADRLVALLERLGLPTRIPARPESVLDALRRDKKRKGAGIHFVLLANIGQAVIEEIPLAELDRVFDGIAGT